MPEKPRLTGFDYFNLPLKILVQHPDYNAHVYRIIMAISNMGNEQLEKLDISGLAARS